MRVQNYKHARTIIRKKNVRRLAPQHGGRFTPHSTLFKTYITPKQL